MAVSSSERETAVFMAKLAEQTQRYDEMVEKMKEVAKMGMELTAEERNLLSEGYWHLIGPRRNSVGLLSSILMEEQSGGNYEHVIRIIEYKKKVETEIIDICTEVLSILDEHLVPSISTPEASVFYNKMKGDHYKCIAMIKTGDDRVEPANEAIKAYKAALATAVEELPRAHSLRLGLDLNMAVFYNVIMDLPQRACEIARQAVAEATPELDNLDEEERENSTKILVLLKENLKLWNSEGNNDS